MKSLLLCYITDRRQLRAVSLAAVIRETLRAGVDMVQIREKDLATRELIALVEEALSASRERGRGDARVVVNDRLDVALAAGAEGVHLGAHSMPVQVVRRVAPPPFVLGVSCHSLGEAIAAESGGADYLVLGPVFETPSKLGYGPPLGLERAAERNVANKNTGPGTGRNHRGARPALPGGRGLRHCRNPHLPGLRVRPRAGAGIARAV